MVDSTLTASVKNKKLLKSQRVAISRFIRAEMAKQGLRFCDLPALLEINSGILLQEVNLRSKINNGSMSADLFLRLCELFKEKDIIDQIKMLRQDVESNS